MAGNTWLDSLPKVELHLHLEGAIPLDALLTLTRKYGASINSREELERRFLYRDFPHFLEIWHWKNQFIREAEDFTQIARAFAEDLVRQNIVYAEAFFSPSDFRSTGLSVGDIATALRKGLDQVDGTTIKLIADLVRDNGPNRASKILDEVNEIRSAGIVGVGIGGSEHTYPPADFLKVFERARELGFRTTAHAGEAAGPESVRDAITELRVERIGHGTRAIEDEAVIQLLIDQNIHVEACPGSNVCTGIIPSIANHPIRTFFDSGIKVSINTDDPMMFNNSLSGELSMLASQLAFERHELVQLMKYAVEAAWCDDAKKAEILALYAE